MQTIIDLPESVYRQSEKVASSKGMSVDELITQALERELAEVNVSLADRPRINLPLIASKHPGSLDLTNFNFDDLLT